MFLKFPSRESTRDLKDLENEASAWKNIYGVKAHARTIGGENVIVMPYVHIFSESDWNDKAMMQVALDGCEHFAAKGYKHHDLKRRHVGKALIEGKLRAIFIDLSYVKKINSKDKDKVMEEMKVTLRQEKCERK